MSGLSEVPPMMFGQRPTAKDAKKVDDLTKFDLNASKSKL